MVAAALRYALLPLELVEGALRFAAARRVPVSHEFIGAYRDVDGDGAQLSEAWLRRRYMAIQQELAQAQRGGLTPWTPGASRTRPGGRPTSAHLRLVAWGFSPAPQALEVYLRSVGLVAKLPVAPRATV